MKSYQIDIHIKLKIKNVEDEYEASQYIDEFAAIGLDSLCYSDDENDDHYELMGSVVDYCTFREDI